MSCGGPRPEGCKCDGCWFRMVYVAMVVKVYKVMRDYSRCVHITY